MAGWLDGWMQWSRLQFSGPRLRQGLIREWEVGAAEEFLEKESTGRRTDGLWEAGE